jgi:histidinol dehydrogenase
MKTYLNPSSSELNHILQRPKLDQKDLSELVETVFSKVKTAGDIALSEFTLKFDHFDCQQFLVSKEEFIEANNLVNDTLKQAIDRAYKNIFKFHEGQLDEPQKIETSPGVTCWRQSTPISKVGLYIPGGSAPLFSTVLMLGVPAKIAGCKTKIMCSPANSEGKIHPAILYAAQLVGIDKVFKLGGIQAIAAMSLGTESVPAVYKIFGPGNQYVTAAKQFATTVGLAIDMPAGPSEVMVVADDSAIVGFVAADLLSQAEHGADSQVILVCDSENFSKEVAQEIEKQLESLPRKETALKALENSKTIVCTNEFFIEIINEYAPEHLILATKVNHKLIPNIENAGSVFLGNYTPESAGDYASGTNHTLPTNGYARQYSGVSVDSFVKKITYQSITKDGLKGLGPIVEIMAEAEQLDAHKNAISIRLTKEY